MLYDRISQIARGASSKKNVMGIQGPQRERGLWSFLTWSFFLSQIAAGNAFASGAAQAAGAADLQGPGGASEVAGMGAGDARVAEFAAIAAEDGQSAAATGAAAPVPSSGVDAGPQMGGLERLDFKSDAGLVGQAIVAARGSGTSQNIASGLKDDNDAAGSPPCAPPSINPTPEPGPGDGVGVPPVVGGIVPPVVDIVEDIVDGVGSGLEDVLEPVENLVDGLAGALAPTLGLALSPVEALVEGLIGGLQETLDPLLTPVANLTEGVGDLLEPVGTLGGEIISLVDPVLDLVDPLLKPVNNLVEAADPILEPVFDAVAPVADLLQPVTDPLLKPLAPVTEPLLEILPLGNAGGGFLSNLLGHGGESDAGVPSDGSLAFASDTGASEHDLFQSGTYTQFGMALHETLSGGESSDGGVVGNVVETIFAPLGESDDDGNSLPILGSLQHEIGLRGLGEGLI